MRTAIEQAAGEIRQAMGRNGRVQGPEWALILELVREVIQVLIARCAPTPEAGYRYLTRRFGPVELLFGADRRRDRRIRWTVAACWRGPADQLADVQAAVLSAVRRRLTRQLMERLYRECDSTAVREVRT
jgi:hypothetical protein